MKKKYCVVLALLFTLILAEGTDSNTGTTVKENTKENLKPKEKTEKEVRDNIDKALKEVQKENQEKETLTDTVNTPSQPKENSGMQTTDTEGGAPSDKGPETPQTGEAGTTPEISPLTAPPAAKVNTAPVKIDPKKPVKQAIDKEKEVPTIYNGEVLKYIATADGYKIYSNGSNVVHPTASVAKIMNILVALDEIDKGKKSLDDKICFDQATANVGGSWLNVKVGECFVVRDLLRAQNIYSANNASYLVAKYIGDGSIDKFVQLMNEKAKSLGMKNTKFYTPAGLPTSMTGKQLDVSTAEDLYLMAKAAMKDPRIREWANEKELILVNSLGEQIVYPSRNNLLGKNNIWGLKTGFHNLSGYNIVVTSKFGNLEIITIFLGEVTEEARTKALLEEYKTIESKIVKVKTIGTDMGEFTIKDGKKKKINGVLSEDVYEIKGNPYEYEVKDLNTKAAIQKGSIIGKLVIKKGGEAIYETNILSSEEVQELSGFGKFLRWITFGWL